MHFIPTYSSWLNQVERFFALITTSLKRALTDGEALLRPAEPVK